MTGYNIRVLKRSTDVVEPEHIEASTLFVLARQVTTLRQKLSPTEREALAKRFDTGAQELANAAIALRRACPTELELPEYLTPNGPPLPARYLRRADEANFHE